MSAEWNCFCELVKINALKWMLSDLNMQQVGFGAAFVRSSHPPGTTVTFAVEQFIATLTSVTEETITSVATGTVIQTTEGYTLQCGNVDGDAVYGEAKVSIPGKFLLETSTS